VTIEPPSPRSLAQHFAGAFPANREEATKLGRVSSQITHVVVRLEPDRHKPEEAVIYAEAGLEDDDDVVGAVEYSVQIENELNPETERAVIDEHLDDVLSGLAEAVELDSGLKTDAAALRSHVVLDLRL
jgi:hypothetical protein